MLRELAGAAAAVLMSLCGPAWGQDGVNPEFDAELARSTGADEHGMRADVLVAKDIDEAKALVGADPVVTKGEMTPEFHTYYGTAALVLLNDLHAKLARKHMKRCAGPGALSAPRLQCPFASVLRLLVVNK